MGTEQLEFSLGFNGLIYIIITLLAVYLAWVLLQEVKWDTLLRRPRSVQARLLQAVLAVVIGHAVARFVIDYFNWSQMLKGFVE